MLESLTPFILLGMAMLSTVVSHLDNHRRGGDKNRKNHVFANFMFLIFLVLPVISKRVSQSFRCVEFDNGDQGVRTFLAVDMAIDCESNKYTFMTLFASAMLLVYPIGAPMVVWIMLWQHRHELNPPGLYDGTLLEEDVIAKCRESPLLEEAPITQFVSTIREPIFFT